MSGQFLREPHVCGTPNAYGRPSGTVWQCDDCGRRWTWRRLAAESGYGRWRPRFWPWPKGEAS